MSSIVVLRAATVGHNLCSLATPVGYGLPLHAHGTPTPEAAAPLKITAGMNADRNPWFASINCPLAETA